MINFNDMSILQAALAYKSRGLNIVPVKQDKRPAVKWKMLQEIPADRNRLQQWFSKDKYPGLAVILGQSSKYLACRDFDEAGSYHAWKDIFPDLARTLPTVQTARGFHVYFQNPECRKVWKQGDGELRGAGGICILPPSLHPSGVQYRWLIPLPEGELPLIDPWTNGMVVTEDALVTEDNEDDEDKEDYEVMLRGKKGVANGPAIDLTLYTKEIEKAINETLPYEPGTRDERLFKLACRLRSIPGWWNIDPKQLEPVLREWHQQALPNIQTKSFETNWFEFLYKWSKVKFRKGQTMTEIMKNLEPVEGVTYETPQLRELVAVCKALQERTNGKPFFLSTVTAGELLGIDRMTAYRWLWMLEQDGWLQVVEKGNARKATRFRFVGRK